MPETIHKVVVNETSQEVAVPEDHIVCRCCDGRGMVSEYDLGTRSLMHEPDLAVKKPCICCDGEGYVFNFAKWKREREERQAKV